MATKAQRLGEAIENLQAGALRAMRQHDEAAARDLLQVSLHDSIIAFFPEWSGIAAQLFG